MLDKDKHYAFECDRTIIKEIKLKILILSTFLIWNSKVLY